MTKKIEKYALQQILKTHQAGDQPYLEFLRHSSMSLGLYILDAGEEDRQKPHEEDEFYLVLEGKGSFFCAGQTVDVAEGTVLFVPKQAEHRFFDITEKLKILVGFAPAEGTTQRG